MKFKFSIIGITAVLIAMFIKNTIDNGFEPLKLLAIVLIAGLLFWIDQKLERPVSRTRIKDNMRNRK
ncbi:hypothetical protein [Macrococcus equipercicus]|uniref:Uncharacterized protein n=1 Tax=Macrococcus equipercicus TaxID=69967 RepID=A0A9Q9F105_9STAP|nr:hypothetical protein [Macrococcus equipercicus]KAA1037695.1 hypothetical protein ERX35_009045 [Macrococcus equipercicus]UTH13407.1 hypothetical protein KFV11_09250 [Macrococcus equipercicus]